VLYDLSERFQVPGEQYVSTGRTYEKDGYIPEWRAIRDDRGRVMVAICHNMHLGDRLGMGRRSPVSGEICLAGFPARDQLRHVRDDALTANRRRPS